MVNDRMASSNPENTRILDTVGVDWLARRLPSHVESTVYAAQAAKSGQDVQPIRKAAEGAN